MASPQTVFTFQGSAGGENVDQAFDFVMARTLAWAHKKTGIKFSDHDKQGMDFQYDEVGSLTRASTLEVDNSFQWAFQYRHPDGRIPGRVWLTEVTVAKYAEDCLVAINLRMTPGAEKFDNRCYSVPGIMTDLAQSYNLYMDAWTKPGQMIAFEGGEKVTEELVSFLEYPNRSSPVVVVPCSDDFDRALGVEPKTLLKNLSGLAHVVFISSSVTQHLHETLGEDLSVYGNAIRVYNPGFKCEEGISHAHPVYDEERLARWKGGMSGLERHLRLQAFKAKAAYPETNMLAFSFGKVSGLQVRLAKIKLQQIPTLKKELATANAMHEFQKETTKLARQSALNWRERYIKAQGKLEELVAQQPGSDVADEALELAAEEEAKRKEAEQKQHVLSSEVEMLRAQLSQLQTEFDGISSGEAEAPIVPGRKTVHRTAFPDLKDLPEWVEEVLQDKLFLHSRAVRALRNSEYKNSDLVYNCLLLLAEEYRAMKLGGEPGLLDKFKARATELKVEDSPSISKTQAGSYGDTYFVDINGQRTFVDKHLKQGTGRRKGSNGAGCLRIYYVSKPQGENNRICVASLPDHLENRFG